MKVPALEHNNEIRGESLDLLKYIDSHFEGPPLFPNVSHLCLFLFIFRSQSLLSYFSYVSEPIS